MTLTTDQLQGATCVVTGGASGIGLAMAERFVAAGMRVVLGDIDEATLAASVERIGPDRALGVVCDVRSVDDVQRLHDAAIDRFGGIEVVCLNAGVAAAGMLADTDLAVWDWTLGVNVMGVVHGVHVFSPTLAAQGHGHVVITASAAGLSATPTMGPYGTSKAAAVGLASALRHELAEVGVGVSALCPGLIDTRIFHGDRTSVTGMPSTGFDPEALAGYRDVVAEVGAPTELVGEVVYRAVLDDQFFVFPTRDFDPAIEGQILNVEQGLAWRDSLGLSS
jgi:NAD(P)-dependent dehydrogenase (short-subunit alcohol dehydrogenase family)